MALVNHRGLMKAGSGRWAEIGVAALLSLAPSAAAQSPLPAVSDGSVKHASRQGTAGQAPKLIVSSAAPEPPAIGATLPAGATVRATDPEIRIACQDVCSAADPGALEVGLDGIPLFCFAGADLARCLTNGLLAGQRQVSEASDVAGNRTTEIFRFELIDPSSDREPPTLLFESPAPGADLAGEKPDLSLLYSDAGAGIDSASFLLNIDGLDLSPLCSVGMGRAECSDMELPDGPHKAVGAASAHRLFSTGKLAAGEPAGVHSDPNPIAAIPEPPVQDLSSPKLAIRAPGALVVGGPAVEIVLDFSDPESGVAPGSLAVALDGVELGSCVLNADGASCPVMLAEGSHLIAAEINNGAGLRAVARHEVRRIAGPDTVPPVVSVVSPAEGAAVESPWQEIRVAYQDALSGADPGSLVLLFDGQPISCQAGASLARCRSPLLEPGTHQLAATIADLAGNVATAGSSFVVAERADSDPPELNLSDPKTSTLYTDTNFVLSISFGDEGSGVDVDTLQVSYDGEPILSSCRISTEEAHCLRPPAIGHHSGTIGIADRAGNRASLSFSFEVKAVASDVEPPEIVLTSDGEALAGKVFPSTDFVAEVGLHDEGAGVEIDSLSIELDGEEISCVGHVIAQQECSIENLPGGPNHEFRVQVKDKAGNLATATAAFSMATAADHQPPILSVSEPSRELELSADPVSYWASWRDEGSGIDRSSIRVTLDGDAEILAHCFNASRLDCTTPPLPIGRHRLEIAVADRQGNPADLTYEFEVYDSSGDRQPPRLEFVAPGEGEALVGVAAVDLSFTLAEESRGSGIDATSFRLEIDGADFSGLCAIVGETANCRGVALADGQHTAVARVADRMGNTARATRRFSTLRREADSAVPSRDPRRFSSSWRVAEARHENKVFATVKDLAGNAVTAAITFTVSSELADLEAPTVALEKEVIFLGSDDRLRFLFRDEGSGVDSGSARIGIDGADVTAACFLGPGSAECGGPLAAGSHSARVRVADRAGNQAMIDLAFEVKPLAADQVPPGLEMTTLDGDDIEGHVFAEQTFAAAVSFSDGGSGTESTLLTITAGGVSAACNDRWGAGYAECYAQNVPVGVREVVARLADRAGNLTTLTAHASFTARTPDTVGPEITFLQPEESGRLGSGPIYLHALFADDKSGLDRGTIAGSLDGDPQALQECLELYLEDDLECPLPPLSAGVHHLVLQASDAAGNRTVASTSFELVDTSTDRDPPSIAFEAPAPGVFPAGERLDVSLLYSDAGAGIDPRSLSLLIDGVDLTALCAIGAGRAECSDLQLPDGPHVAVGTIRDRMGNAASATLHFSTTRQAPDTGGPRLEVVGASSRIRTPILEIKPVPKSEMRRETSSLAGDDRCRRSGRVRPCRNRGSLGARRLRRE